MLCVFAGDHADRNAGDVKAGDDVTTVKKEPSDGDTAGTCVKWGPLVHRFQGVPRYMWIQNVPDVLVTNMFRTSVTQQFLVVTQTLPRLERD